MSKNEEIGDPPEILLQGLSLAEKPQSSPFRDRRIGSSYYQTFSHGSSNRNPDAKYSPAKVVKRTSPAMRTKKQPPTSLTLQTSGNVSEGSSNSGSFSSYSPATGARRKTTHRHSVSGGPSTPKHYSRHSTTRSQSGSSEHWSDCSKVDSFTSGEETCDIHYPRKKFSGTSDDETVEVPVRVISAPTTPKTPSRHFSGYDTVRRTPTRQQTPKTPRKSPKPFESYLSLEEVQRGLKKGELIEDGQMDIYIGGIHDRNRAFNGDVVVVQLKPCSEWKVLQENLSSYLDQYNLRNTKDNCDEENNVILKALLPRVNSEQELNEEKRKDVKKKKRRGKRSKKKKSNCTNAEEEKENDDTVVENEMIDEKFSGSAEIECSANETSLKKKRKRRKKKKQFSNSKSDIVVLDNDSFPNEAEPMTESCDLIALPSKQLDTLKATECSTADPSKYPCIVPPHELSETEDQKSLSGGSVCSFELDQVVEDLDFMDHMRKQAQNDDCLSLNALKTYHAVSEQKLAVSCSEDQMLSSIAEETGNQLAGIEITYKFPSSPPENSEVNFNIIDNHSEEPQVVATSLMNICLPSTLSANTPHLITNLIPEQLKIEELLKLPFAHKFIQKTGKVVYISEKKHTRTSVGHLSLMQDKNSKFVLFRPKDHRIPRMMIPMEECPPGFMVRTNDFANTLFIARIAEWNNTGLAMGHLYRSLGEAGEIEVETEGILIENGIDYSEFPEFILEELPQKIPWTIPESELKHRKDLREECIFTIDPLTARDLDDAVSCKLLSDGLYEVGVHIADVTFFVKEGTKVDEIAANRATSVYLVQKVIPMLPRILCEHLCSLNPGEDRLTFSVIWKMTEEGEIVDEWFGRTVINSCIKLSYEHAQQMIENPAKVWSSEEHPPLFGGFSINDVSAKVTSLHAIALKLRKKRFSDGALRLDQVKLQFTLSSDTGFPSGFSVYEQKDSNRLIEEFMLLANMAVAHKIYNKYSKNAVLRRHPPPTQHMMEETEELCSTLGLSIDITTAGGLQNSLSRYMNDDPLSCARVLVLTHLFAKPMNCALYFCSGSIDDAELYRHYALSVPLYTHFTSPIRRYADIMVHRLLAAALDYSKKPLLDEKVAQKQCEHCNDKKLTSKRVQEMSSELFLGVFIKECGPIQDEGMVVGVMDHSFDVLLLKMGCIKRIYCDQLPLDNIHFEKISGLPHLVLTWKANERQERVQQVITILSLVQVNLSSSKELTKFNAILLHPDDNK